MSAQKKAALFVDFDNIYLGLRQIDPHAAEEFATNPSRWLAWLERYRNDLEHGADDEPNRRILLRNCYLNPRSFSRFRADFSRTGFRVVDCPPITRQGKTSTDIHMVMDILDTLQHTTHFDEFILLSADADFTPVLFRLRVHDRRTLVVSVGPASPAYRSAADRLVAEEEFVTLALGGRPGGRSEGLPSASTDDAVLDEIADALVDAATSEGPLAPAAVPRIFVRFHAFRESTDWLGHWSLRGLTDALVARRPESIVVEEVGAHWSIVAADGAARVPSPSQVVVFPELVEEIVECVVELVQASQAPVPMASAAQHVMATLGENVAKSDWGGAGSFKAIASTLAAAGVQLIQLSATRWVLIDPERHEIPEAADAVGGETPAARLARRISRTTGVPALTSEQYSHLFAALHGVLVDGEYDLTETSKAVRDVLLERGHPISRTSISFVLRGLSFVGHPLDGDDARTDPKELATAFRRQIESLCEDADLHLTSGEETLVDAWILTQAS